MRRRTLLSGAAALLAAGTTGCGSGGGTGRVGGVGGRTPSVTVVDPQRIAYGTDPSQFGQLFLPDGDPRGLVVVVHGGFWLDQYGLEYGEPLAEDLRSRGWAAWNIEYRRVGSGGGVPATVDDVVAAVAAVADLPLGHDHTTKPVVGLGHSAGGQLATIAAGHGGLTHVVSQAGVLDLRAAHRAGLGNGAVEEFLGHPPTTDDADVDPIQSAPLAVPIWCVHGRDDRTVPRSQSSAYVEAATTFGARAELVEADGDHFDVIDPAATAWARTVEIIEGIG